MIPVAEGAETTQSRWMAERVNERDGIDSLSVSKSEAELRTLAQRARPQALSP